ncbi:hypothetical protein W97_06249 [Coniosporium apollinis CBS 100218]|uniref:Uncharacterized protein n=1 Tax=Coniosporium apollinis (strain CBS 100218) TaxID=1168221 RepID=R7YY63_CONA1|nr:uncharacterized protein W97_06249 [Coniosporium apollinis CBS 100218]EON66847.1 hypothetical protein W97_06249 [Coniosporium apollinis CBS 100218]
MEKRRKSVSRLRLRTAAIPFLGAPLITPVISRYYAYQQEMIWAGWITCSLGLIAASFAKGVWHLVLTQGVAYGIGFLVLYYPLLNMLNDWFIKRRGLAHRILFASSSPIVLVGPTLPLLRSRTIKADAARRPANLQIDFKIPKKPTFLILAFFGLF